MRTRLAHRLLTAGLIALAAGGPAAAFFPPLPLTPPPVTVIPEPPAAPSPISAAPADPIAVPPVPPPILQPPPPPITVPPVDIPNPPRPEVVPEPATLASAGLGLAVVGAGRRWRRSAGRRG